MSMRSAVIMLSGTIVLLLGIAWCETGCDTPVYSPSDIAEKTCIDQAEAGQGRAAMRASIDACRADAKDGGAK